MWNFNLQKRTRLQRFSAPKRVQNFDKIAQPQKGQFFQIWCKAIYGHGKFVLKVWMGNSIVKIYALLKASLFQKILCYAAFFWKQLFVPMY